MTSEEFKTRVAASLYGMYVGDALAMPVHWFYSPTSLRSDYGEITGMVAPKATHAESMVQGMSYSGTLDIMHDKARFFEGNQLASEAATLSEAEIEARRDGHGNYVGATADKRVHYHQSLKKGQNTANACVARIAMRYLAEANAGSQDCYDPDEFLRRFYDYMMAAPDPQDDDQVVNHNDTYLDVYCRGFFSAASAGKPLRDCALSQRDSWSIGSLDGVAMAVPVIAAYAHESEWYVIGRAVEHHMLTHRSVTVTACVAVLVPILQELYRGAPLRVTLDQAMRRMRPPKITGQEMALSYVSNKGPGAIPKHEKWLQHMVLDANETTCELVHRMLSWEDEDVAGLSSAGEARLATACYCEHAFTIVLFLAYKYGPDSPSKALLQNVMLGGHSTARGAVLGAILGAAHGEIPFADQLCAKQAIDREVKALVATLPS